MNLLTDIVAAALASIPLLLTLGLVTLMLALAHFLLIRRNRDLGNERLFSRQLIMLALTLIGLVAVILALPVARAHAIRSSRCWGYSSPVSLPSRLPISLPTWRLVC
ncbi:hypothetical protein ULF88_04045 [Halopseudomonas pachastrellae]|nr:hypothetical protein [Halopseudomonas pachastrellae]